MAESLYDVLGVATDATTEEIRKAFKKKVKIHHPDVGGSKEEFQKIEEADRILADPEARERYDLTGDTSGPNPNLVEELALKFIFQAMGAILQDDEPEKIAIIQHLSETMDTNLLETERVKTNLEKDSAKLTRVLGRLKTKREDDPIRSMITGQMAAITKGLDDLKVRTDAFSRAKEILADYQFDRDKTEPTFEELYAKNMRFSFRDIMR